MENTITTYSSSWEIAPTSAIAGTILTILFLYLFFRHMLFALMFMDIVLGWLRQFRWFPKEGKRRKAIVHWFIAVGLFLGFLTLSGSAGWLQFIPK